MGVESKFGNMTIGDVRRIWAVPDTQISSVKDIASLVELPLINAVTVLFNKGIRTYWSTANARQSFAAICIEPKYLSSTNVEVAKSNFGFRGEADENVMLQRPITRKTPVQEVDSYFVELANRFVDQR